MSTNSKVWLITGASVGFGRALAEEALGRGDRVVAAARNISPLASLASQAPERVLVRSLDVAKREEIQQAVDAAVSHFGRIDVLVNNAGFGVVGAVEETTEAELRQAMEVMFFGAAALTQAVLPQMRARQSGTIVQVSSMGGITTAPGFGAYCAAKHALEGFSESLASEVGPLGIKVLIVEPGAFRTQLFGGNFHRAKTIDAYAETVGKTRAYADSSDGKQPGDPKKAARAIVDAVYQKDSPLRLPLGADAVDAIRQKLTSVAQDIDQTEKVARDTTLD